MNIAYLGRALILGNRVHGHSPEEASGRGTTSGNHPLIARACRGTARPPEQRRTEITFFASVTALVAKGAAIHAAASFS
jgi:hypothetical protein